MELFGWISVGAVVAVAVLLVVAAPALLRDTRRRQARGLGGSLAGVGSGMDAIWRPSAEDAHAQWEAQIELPAPAPTPGDGGTIDDGRISIRVDDQS